MIADLKPSCLSRRTVLAGAAAAAASVLAPTAGAQAPFPARVVRLVVPFPAGTSPDVIARLWGQRFSKSSGQAVIVENRPGAGTIIATQAVAKAAADGYTLLWTVNNTFSINPFVYRSLPYRAEDFVPVMRILSVPFVLVVSADSPVRSLDDLVRAAKARPGALSYASPGIATSPHVVMARLLKAAGVTMTHVPYKDSYITDLTAQRIDVAFDASGTVLGQLRSGKLRALGVSSAQRINVDGLRELAPIGSTYPGFVGESWQGIFAPKGTPEDVISAIVDHAQRIVDAPDFRDTLTEYGLVPAGGSSATFRQFLVEDARGWEQVVKTNQITMD